MRKTKIIATLGPASEGREMIERLIKAGVNVFRLNFSHGDHSYHRALIRRVRDIASRLGMPAAILQDIAGPKIRVGTIDGIMKLEPGDHLSLFVDKTRGKDLSVTINHPEILKTLRSGDSVYFADGAIRSEVVANEPPGRVTVKVLIGGKLTSRKGVNFPGTDLKIEAITEKDKRDIAFGVAQDVDYLALSFVRRAEDVGRARELVADLGGDIPLIAKIEKAAALEHLDAIMRAADGIMVARGDLGVELGVHKVPVVQKSIISQASRYGLPVITATQMLTSMLTSAYPTRAEVSDIANAVLDGTDAVMLSDETAMGSHPLEAIEVLNATITETETIYPWDRQGLEITDSRDAIAAAATDLAQSSGANGIICFSSSGFSAQKIAGHRPRTRLIAVTSSTRTFRRLALIWGVEPFFVAFSHANSDRMISHFIQQARAAGMIRREELHVITIGHHSNLSGTTNQIQLMDEQAFERMQEMLASLRDSEKANFLSP